MQNMTQTHTPRFWRSENGYARHAVDSVRLGLSLHLTAFSELTPRGETAPVRQPSVLPFPAEESGFHSAALLIHE